jgi:hypothetical protein
LAAQNPTSARVSGVGAMFVATGMARGSLAVRESTLPSSPVRISVAAPVQMHAANNASMHTKNKSRAGRRRRRRSSLAVSAMPSSAEQHQPLEPNPVPDYLALDDVEDLVVDRNGVVEGGSPMALLRWACRCAWLSSSCSTEVANDPSQARTYAKFSSDVKTFLVTFTDFTTPEAIVETLEVIISEHPEESWGLQQFLLLWLDYDFYQVCACTFLPPPSAARKRPHLHYFPPHDPTPTRIRTTHGSQYSTPYTNRHITVQPSFLANTATAANTPRHHGIDDSGRVDLGTVHPPQQGGCGGCHGHVQKSHRHGTTRETRGCAAKSRGKSVP